MKIFQSLLIVMTSLICLFFILTNIVTAEEPIHPDYPYVFDVTGRLDRISNQKLVIDDTLFTLSPSTTYHAPDMIFKTPSNFHIKDVIGVILKDQKTREISSVWLIERAD